MFLLCCNSIGEETRNARMNKMLSLGSCGWENELAPARRRRRRKEKKRKGVSTSGQRKRNNLSTCLRKGHQKRILNNALYFCMIISSCFSFLLLFRKDPSLSRRVSGTTRRYSDEKLKLLLGPYRGMFCRPPLSSSSAVAAQSDFQIRVYNAVRFKEL